MLGPNLFLGLNTSLYSYLFFRTALVPQLLFGFGIVGAVLVFIAGIVEMFGIVEAMSSVKAIIALPVAVYEMILAVWLIAKGFNKRSLAQLRE